MEQETDPMWPHFAPLWTDLRATSPDFVLAGGYGLFLKQRWLQAKAEIRMAVEWPAWRKPIPRTTKDLDLVVNFELIASRAGQPKVGEILGRHGFRVVEANARWQFEKRLADDRSVLIDFHSTVPSTKRDGLRIEARRVKPKPSIGNVGIHGRENPEAEGCTMNPFPFEMESVAIVVPNPMAWSLMKLIAMRDRWRSSQDAEREAGERNRWREDAMKHAQDICRSIAMMTREESDNAKSVLQQLRLAASFDDACGIYAEFFKSDEARGWVFVRDHWTEEALGLIHETLSRWFT